MLFIKVINKAFNSLLTWSISSSIIFLIKFLLLWKDKCIPKANSALSSNKELAHGMVYGVVGTEPP